MNEEELNKMEEGLKEREATLQANEATLQGNEDELKKREEELKKREEDVNALVANIKEEYEAKLARQASDYDKRLEERNRVIKQLLNGDNAVDNAPSEIEKLNARRKAQRKFWPLALEA